MLFQIENQLRLIKVPFRLTKALKDSHIVLTKHTKTIKFLFSVKNNNSKFIGVILVIIFIINAFTNMFYD